MIFRFLIISVFIGIASAQFPDKESPFTFGINEDVNIPFDARQFIELDRDREMQYDIGLAFHIIYGKYALTYITLHLSINEHFESGGQTAGILLYDI